jgi:hypothetical protein
MGFATPFSADGDSWGRTERDSIEAAKRVARANLAKKIQETIEFMGPWCSNDCGGWRFWCDERVTFDVDSDDNVVCHGDGYSRPRADVLQPRDYYSKATCSTVRNFAVAVSCKCRTYFWAVYKAVKPSNPMPEPMPWDPLKRFRGR